MPSYQSAIELYKKLDISISEHFKTHKKQPPCNEGCTSCCSQFFEVSELEFALIFEKITAFTGPEKYALKMRAATLYSLFAEYWPTFFEDYFQGNASFKSDSAYYSHAERFEVHLPCVFLNDAGSCLIYEARPTTCRITGVGFTHLINHGPVCEKIRYGLLTPLWQADLRKHTLAVEDVKWIENPASGDAYKRQFPLFYLIHKLFEEDQFEAWQALLNEYKTADSTHTERPDVD